MVSKPNVASHLQDVFDREFTNVPERGPVKGIFIAAASVEANLTLEEFEALVVSSLRKKEQRDTASLADQNVLSARNRGAAKVREVLSKSIEKHPGRYQIISHMDSYAPERSRRARSNRQSEADSIVVPGQIVIYPGHGIYEVIGSEQKEYEGVTEDYLVLSSYQPTKPSSGHVFVAVNKIEKTGLRLPMSRQDLTKVLMNITQPASGDAYNDQRCRDILQDRISAGSVEDLLFVVRETYGRFRREEITASHKKHKEIVLTENEYAAGDRAIEFLAQEISYVSGVNRKEIQTFLKNRALHKSLPGQVMWPEEAEIELDDADLAEENVNPALREIYNRELDNIPPRGLKRKLFRVAASAIAGLTPQQFEAYIKADLAKDGVVDRDVLLNSGALEARNVAAKRVRQLFNPEVSAPGFQNMQALREIPEYPPRKKVRAVKQAKPEIVLNPALAEKNKELGAKIASRGLHRKLFALAASVDADLTMDQFEAYVMADLVIKGHQTPEILKDQDVLNARNVAAKKVRELYTGPNGLPPKYENLRALSPIVEFVGDTKLEVHPDLKDIFEQEAKNVPVHGHARRLFNLAAQLSIAVGTPDFAEAFNIYVQTSLRKQDLQDQSLLNDERNIMLRDRFAATLWDHLTAEQRQKFDNYPALKPLQTYVSQEVVDILDRSGVASIVLDEEDGTYEITFVVPEEGLNNGRMEFTVQPNKGDQGGMNTIWDYHPEEVSQDRFANVVRFPGPRAV